MELALGALYSESAVANGITTDLADLIFASIPYKVLPALQKPQCDEMKKRDAELYKRLEDAGFLLDFGADETKVRFLFESELATGKTAPRKKPELTPRARRAVCLAAEEAQRAGRVSYGPEHLLIGLLRANEGAGFQMLGSLGVGLEAVRAKITADSPRAGTSEQAAEADQSE